RLLHHHRDVPRRAGLDHLRVVVGVRESGDRVGVRALEHGRQVGEEQLAVEAEAGGVFACRAMSGSSMPTSCTSGWVFSVSRKPLAWPWTRPARARRRGGAGFAEV